MDDLMICERTIAEMDRSVELLYRILTTVGLSLAESKTYHMGLQWQEPPGKTKYELRMHGDWGPSVPGERSADRVYRGANEITRIEVDVGLRELGIWVDGLSDWGEQLQKIRESLDGVLTELGRKRIPLELANYLWKAVSTPNSLRSTSTMLARYRKSANTAMKRFWMSNIIASACAPASSLTPESWTKLKI